MARQRRRLGLVSDASRLRGITPFFVSSSRAVPLWRSLCLLAQRACAFRHMAPSSCAAARATHALAFARNIRAEPGTFCRTLYRCAYLHPRVRSCSLPLNRSARLQRFCAEKERHACTLAATTRQQPPPSLMDVLTLHCAHVFLWTDIVRRRWRAWQNPGLYACAGSFQA